MDYKVSSMTVEQTRAWGKTLAGYLRPGDVVALWGDLGAGKTAMAQGIGAGLGIRVPVTSPTFTLIHEYEGFYRGTKVRFLHMDLYRLQHPQEAEVIGLEESFTEDAVCLIEWPEIALDYLPQDYLEVEILGSGEQAREIFFRAPACADWEQRIKDMLQSREQPGGDV